MPLVLKGNIIHTTTFGEIEIVENGYLVSEEGKIIGVFNNLPQNYKECEIFDYGNKLIMQSFSDMHLHAPQFPMLGTGMDLELLDWLNSYTFPTESHFKDPEYARKIYRIFANTLAKIGTTRVCMFSSLHLQATLILMEELEKAGITGYVGKVNMDRNSIEKLSETTAESIRNTQIWLEKSKSFHNIKPIITPRFTPSCTDELMEFLGKTAKTHNLPIQSHLSENMGEILWVKELHPDTIRYYQSYEKFGLWNNKTLMAHCVHSDKIERDAIKKAGVYVVHCADSNINLSSGVAPIRKMIDEGINVVLGSDIAGGDHLCGFDVINATIRASKIRSIYDEEKPKMFSIKEAWYLATSMANNFFDEQPGFAKGNDLHAIVLDDSLLVNTDKLTVQERFERAIYLRQENAIVATYSKGKLIYKK